MRSQIDNWHIRYDLQERNRRVELGKQLREIRRQEGLSKERAAELMNISIDFLGKIERGAVSPEYPNVLKKINSLKEKEFLQIV